MKEQLIMDNREVQEKFNRYKDTVVSLGIWENQPIQVDFIYYADIKDKEIVKEILKEIDVREIQRIYVSDFEYDIHVSKKYLFKLLKGKNVRIFNTMY
ncbi:MAG: hypothetical protein QXL94_07270 [Candidatus Parvarchaeum sp.]